MTADAGYAYARVYGGLVKMDQAGHDLAEVAAFGRNLSARDLHSMFVRLVERGVALRRGRYVTLQPPAIAACLAERQWREWISAERDSILGGNTDHDLKVNAAKQLALLNTTETAREVVRQVRAGRSMGERGCCSPVIPRF